MGSVSSHNGAQQGQISCHDSIGSVFQWVVETDVILPYSSGFFGGAHDAVGLLVGALLEGSADTDGATSDRVWRTWRSLKRRWGPHVQGWRRHNNLRAHVLDH